MTMNVLQQLKAYGLLQGTSAKNLPNLMATRQQVDMVERRFCGHPDYVDAEIAESDDPEGLGKYLGVDSQTCQGIIDMHRRLAMSDAGEYNNNRWPKCYPDVTPHHAVRYFLDRDTFPAHYKRPVTTEELQQVVEAKVWGVTLEELRDLYDGKPMLDVAYEFINKAYARVGCVHIEATDGPGGKHNVHIKSVAIPGSTIGVAWFPDGTCGDHVNQHIDSTYRPGLMGTMKLGCHEWGHNHGEPHQFAGQSTHKSVMSYSPPSLFYGFSTGQPPHTLPRDRSIDSLLDKYGGPIADEPTPPTPPTPPGDPGYTLPTGAPNGAVVLDGKLHDVWITRRK